MASHIALLEHQKIGLTWLQKMEDGTNRGGILGDDMGLGKTVQTMALIVSRPSGPIDDPATLIVAPVALVYQWAEELKTKTQPGLLKVHIYHGSSKFADPEILRRYDAVVITTNITLTNDSGVYDVNPNKCRPIGPLFKAHFHRVVIDEAHTIKNRNTKSSKACALIAATYRWCLTGTPIQNSVDELYSLIRFLAIKPYCDWDEFRNKISTPMKKTRQYGSAMQRVQALLKAVCLRRTKKCTVDGKPIFDLPARNVTKVHTPFSDDERSFYVALEQRTRDRFNAYVKAGTVMKNYSNILVLLLRLRQACCHPHLINDFEKITDDQTPHGQKAHVDSLLDNLLEDICRRLLERGLDAIECPICMDVGEESMILSGCGHIYCRACIIAHLSRHDEDDRNCPECRRAAPLDNLISVADFNARFNPTPEVIPEDVKGKGKAVDQDGDICQDTALNIQVPEELDDWISSSKIDRMVAVVKDVIAKGEKIIVFSQFTSLLTLIEKPLNEENIKFLRYDGAMKMEARNEAVLRLFSDPTYSVMLISLKCGSLGLNLTVANHVVIMDPWWNPALENQAIDRVHRIGQTKEVFVHRLYIPETVEDRILALQASKQALADGALGEGTVPKLAKLGVRIEDLCICWQARGKRKHCTNKRVFPTYNVDYSCKS
ncbi:SNF2 family N-terminal domain-containing protein [Dissophora ornata]|nr:SNF2 family N-terminal domain-containing protein [Dissophora ornata]